MRSSSRFSRSFVRPTVLRMCSLSLLCMIPVVLCQPSILTFAGSAFDLTKRKT
jgi:hypothetical protein